MKHNKILKIKIDNNKWDLKDDSTKIFENFSTYIEKNSSSLKKQYLNFINDLTNYHLNNKSIKETFNINNGYNLWWMSKITEKSIYKSSSIFNSIKLLALEKIIISNSYKKIILSSENIEIIRPISNLCESLDIDIVINQNKNKFQNLKRNSLYYFSFLINFLKGIFFIIKKIISINAFEKPSPNFFSGNNSIFIFSYFIHLDFSKSKKGIFYSRQWEMLPDILNSKKININWIHHFLYSQVVHNPKHADQLIREFNNSNKNQFHNFIDSYISLTIIIKVLIYYLKTVIKHIKLNSFKNAFIPNGSNLNLWPVMKNDWFESFSGSYLAQNLFWIFQMDKLFKDIPYQKTGLYLNENQGWERCLLSAWKKHNHGKIIAIQHSTLRFWDLRYFDHPEILKHNGKFSQPKPDLIAVNGPIPYKFYKESKYDLKKIIKVEAIRYLFHSNPKNFSKRINQNKFEEKILILGNVTKKSTVELLELLNNNFDKKIEFVLKAHPSALIDTKKYSSLSISESNENMETILFSHHTCIAVGDTSSALDAFLTGLNVIVFLPSGELNTSPLREFNDVSFVQKYFDLNKSISLINKTKNISRDKESYFWLDQRLTLWNSLIQKHIDEPRT